MWGKLISHNGKYSDIDLVEDVVRIGRSHQCQVHIDSPFISGKHCTVNRDKHYNVFVTDTRYDMEWFTEEGRNIIDGKRRRKLTFLLVQMECI